MALHYEKYFYLAKPNFVIRENLVNTLEQETGKGVNENKGWGWNDRRGDRKRSSQNILVSEELEAVGISLLPGCCGLG